MSFLEPSPAAHSCFAQVVQVWYDNTRTRQNAKVSKREALRAKNLVSTRFFTLPKHAGALQCVGIVNEKFVKTISR